MQYQQESVEVNFARDIETSLY